MSIRKLPIGIQDFWQEPACNNAASLFFWKKELFMGLAMEKLETEWNVYPVLKFSLASGMFTKPDGLSTRLKATLEEFEKKYELSGKDEDLTVRFEHALKNAVEKTGRKVAVLVDEYDTPLLKNIGISQKGKCQSKKYNEVSYLLILRNERVIFPYRIHVIKP